MLPPSTLDPSTGPGPTVLPTGPSWTPRPAESLLVGAAVRATVDELNVRERPSLDARRVGTVSSDNVMVIWPEWAAPIEADGYTWYSGIVVSANGELPPLGNDLFGSGEVISGWFAAARGDTSYVRPVAPRCPEVIDLRHVGYMLPAERLACFGDNSLVFEGSFGCGGCGAYVPGEFKPRWLAHPINFALLTAFPRSENAHREHLVLRFPSSGSEQPSVASVIRVHGRFDDDRAERCEMAVPVLGSDSDTFVSVGAPVAELLCRQQFVVESFEIIGTDPDFPFG